MWLLTAPLVLAALGGQELIWRGAGYEASVSDNMDLWSYWRQQVEVAGPDTVVLLGDSRIGWGFAPEAFQERWPEHRLVQLYAPMRHPVAILADLAEDEQFRGVVVCAIQAEALLPEQWHDSQDYVDYYRREWTFTKSLSRQFRTALEDRLVILHPKLTPRYLIKGIFGRWPKPEVYRILPNRHSPGDFTLRPEKDAAKELEQRAEIQAKDAAPLRDVTPEQWLERVRELDGLVKRIQARGGQVVFTQWISSGRVLEVQKSLAPREKFWDVMAANTSAVTIHYQDVPGLGDFTCPDGVHLGARDAAEYTRRLCEELGRRGVLRDGGN